METYGITKEKLYIFNNGEDFMSYNAFGAHPYSYDGKIGWRFLVYAPNALSVAIVSNSLGWDNGIKMQSLYKSGCFISFIENLNEGEVYKYKIETANHEFLYKSDPYAFYSEVRPNTASILYDYTNFKWSDEKFLLKREKTNHQKIAKNIYEVHLGSWKQKFLKDRNLSNEETPLEAFYSYKEFAQTLIPYVKEMGYTHIELMPLHEYPFDGSWGYQPTGFFSITSRYGTPKDFMEFVNLAHKENISVILDWVPGHFCKDDHGLRLFDGSKVYEEKEHLHWGTLTFNYSKSEVRSFLLSNVFFFLKEFHIDGIRMDGVSSMLYLNYGVEDPSKKVFNKYGGEGNLSAIDFIKKTNDLIHKEFKGVITIAEESSSWPKVTSFDDDGLHFDYKWDMGWMHDTLNYCKTDFPYRSKNHNMLTFSMVYAFSEHFIMPLSHDEVVHGKCSLIVKQPGEYLQKFAGLRLLLLYQITHSGGKLNFMGTEIAQFVEWRFYESIQWFLLDYPIHRMHLQFVKELNNLYKNEKALYEEDYTWKGFQWIEANDNSQSVYIYERSNGNSKVIIILNMKPIDYEIFTIGVEEFGEYEIIFNSDDSNYGGNDYIKNFYETNNPIIKSKKIQSHGKDYSIDTPLPALSGLIIKKKKTRRKNV
ncbi:MAG: 1,4-alpha-glucan branching protein GlgB [Eubacteriales bacterium]|nr:1,4-alpha-glucan branching protein GlgB [Eubacteriales bacterium]